MRVVRKKLTEISSSSKFDNLSIWDLLIVVLEYY